MRGIVILILVLLALVAGSFVLYRQLVRQAVKGLIKTFFRLQALEPESAVTQEQVGVSPPRGVLDTRMGFRDHRPAALALLVQVGIVAHTPEGKLYLIKDALMRSSLRDFAPDSKS